MSAVLGDIAHLSCGWFNTADVGIVDDAATFSTGDICKLILNLDGTKLNWSCESNSQKRKCCWENNCSISTAESKIRKIYVYGDKNEITKLNKREHVDPIDNTIQLAGEHSQKETIYYPFLYEVQNDFTELSVFENSPKGNQVLGVIKGDIEFYGTLLITLLSGQISINGFKAIKNQPLTIYSPRGINWVSIKTMKRKRYSTEDKINLEELSHFFSYMQLENIKDKYNYKEDAIVLFQRNTVAKNLVSIFNRNMAQNIFPQFHGTNRPHYQSEFLLSCLIQRASKANILQVPPVWAKLKLKKNSRMIVVGGKNVGKSTLVRFLINRHLHRFSRILLIDLDIGQPEVFIPQTISCTLINGPHLGPGFFFNKEPDRAYVVGDINIVMCAEQYVRAVKQLLEYVHKNSVYMEIPWLINTMGYNKGFGQELIAFLIKTIKPTDVVEISSSNRINNFNFPLEWKLLKHVKPIICMNEQLRAAKIKKYALHRLPTMVPHYDPEIWTMSSKDMRYSNLLARLSKCLKSNLNCFSGCQPFRASLQDLEIIHPNCKMADREELIAGMEANVVYLGKLTYRGLPECLGLAIVRAVDYVQNLVYLSPSLSVSALSQVNCIILAGELTLPTGFFKDQGPSVTNDVPFVFRLDGSKSSKAIQQIYCRPSSFFKQTAKRKKKQSTRH
ncbi:uncharacterized protein Dwil_GK26913 [Drosophila willistoni]|uniref:Polynucleotide 5'-hydroxyl-kinase NOL9 n=1 Tax=Drosophila willistoni TaxID=7260 RepID=A0A0Q9X3Z4_DROWI|nr:uncharacterized protein Dwil_GK26913 [Drosophila willistoni]